MKFLYGYFDQKTGESVVGLADKYGTYTGQAKLHPEDKKYASKYTGCNIAQARAKIKALKSRRYRNKIKINTIKDIAQDIELNTDNNSKVNKRLNIKLKNYNKEIKDIDKEIEEIKEHIRQRLEIRNKIIKKTKK